MVQTKSLTLDELKDAVTGGACAFRSRTNLQPAGGEGDKVFPPTYAGAAYAREQRRLPGREEPVDCVLLDSVPSQANRMEEALQAAADEGRLQIPLIVVDFSEADRDLLTPIGRVTSLQAPHRVADAILRDSLLDGTPFRKTDEAKCLDTASIANATPLYRLCPAALIFGMWDSTGPKGGMGAKFQRAMVGEIVGIDAVFGVKTHSRIDPLGIVKDAGPLFRTPDGGWTLCREEALAKEGKLVLYKPKDKKDVLWDPKMYEGKVPEQGRPSEANHSNVIPDFDYRKEKKQLILDKNNNPIHVGGVTIRSAEQTVTLSLPALRRLQFPVEDSQTDQQEVNAAGRSVLAALGLCAASLAAEKGLDLRSRCLLWPTEPMVWELLDRPGERPMQFALNSEAAIGLLNEAVARAEHLGLHWRNEPLVLKPAPQLVELVKKSQKLGATSDDDGEAQ